MRWELLFDDLEARLREGELAERAGEIAERTRLERAAVGLADRFAAQNAPIEVTLTSGRTLLGRVGDVGLDWLTLTVDDGSRALLPLGSLVQVTGLGGAADTARAARALRRFGVGHALRGIARDRRPVLVHDVLGRAVPGTIDAVGRDLVEISEHPLDLPRRRENVLARRVIPWAAVVYVSDG